MAAISVWVFALFIQTTLLTAYQDETSWTPP